MLTTARIETLEKNFLVAVPVSYNEPHFFFIKRDMKTIIREADASEWLWATTEWNSPLERGKWEIGNDDWFEVQTALREERRKSAFQILEKKGTSTTENGNVKISIQELTEQEVETLRQAADGFDSWYILNSVGGSCGKEYRYECELPSGNYTFAEIVISRGKVTDGITVFFMND